ncbi:hypothetical protein SCLCIDRAFT_6228 [Scleroderma citrinum Foug A]|uniref:Uncharacterized protein n=1 Tax=Scleroderma citrinum Foug A TaxID=1036808 RepID=A0A0C3ES36_9AGAM|nr:hypothetical protein SCLCIDRAFT_6228 [Scleroderma citrinum Foug A]
MTKQRDSVQDPAGPESCYNTRHTRNDAVDTDNEIDNKKMGGLARLDSLLDECLSHPLLLPIDLETPYSNFHSANFIPAPPDIASIDVVLQQRHVQLSLIQSAVRKLATLKTRLEQSASYVTQSVLSHKALTSPVRRVPPEVLGEIFFHCLPTAPYVTPHDVEGPMVLTQVCRHWRAVARSTPRLWSSITLHLDRATSKEYMFMCEAWLARAKSLPLAIRVLNDLDGSYLAATPGLVYWLRHLLTRCRDIWWHGPAMEDVLDDVTTPLSSGAVIPLTRLRVTSHRGTHYTVRLPSAVRHLSTASLQCPNLHLRTLDHLSIPWSQLTELTLHFALLDSTTLLQTISLCTSLRVLTASCLCADPDQLASLRTLGRGAIYQDTLRRLELRVIRHGMDALLDALTMPALEELDVVFCYPERDPWPHEQFADFVKRSGGALKKLVVRQNKGVLKHMSEYGMLLPDLAIMTR